MGYVFLRRYACPYRSRHRVRGGLAVFYCTLTHGPCRYRPSSCPIRRAHENNSILDYVGGGE